MRADKLAAIEATADSDDLDAVIEVVGVSPQLETRRHAVLDDLAELVTGWWLGHSDPTPQHRLTAVALVGGVNHVLVDWLLSGRTQQSAELVQACVNLFAGARQRFTPPAE